MKKALIIPKKIKNDKEIKMKAIDVFAIQLLNRDSKRDVFKIEMQNISKDSSAQIDRNSMRSQLIIYRNSSQSFVLKKNKNDFPLFPKLDKILTSF